MAIYKKDRQDSEVLWAIPKKGRYPELNKFAIIFATNAFWTDLFRCLPLKIIPNFSKKEIFFYN